MGIPVIFWKPVKPEGKRQRKRIKTMVYDFRHTWEGLFVLGV